MRHWSEAGFWARVEEHPDTGCWLWQGILDRRGYPTIGGRFAHRISYRMLIGPIPEGLMLDHLCRTPRCVNPGHLEPVTNTENVRRGYWGVRQHCKNGHALTAENIRMYQGARICRRCDVIKTRRYQEKLRAA